jgi:hypothetical protein
MIVTYITLYSCWYVTDIWHDVGVIEPRGLVCLIIISYIGFAG